MTDRSRLVPLVQSLPKARVAVAGDAMLDVYVAGAVDRISPEDCNAIRTGGAATTLKGIELNNFGAFFSRAYRENDYLWGRLHGVERLIDIVLSSLPAGTGIAESEIRNFKRTAFEAILDQEAPRLNRIKPLIKSLRSEIEALGGTAP